MTDAFITKNVELSLEFDRYMATHPNLFDKIPNGAHIIITVKDDPEFNKSSVSMVRHVKRSKVVEAHKTAKRWSLRPLQPATAR